MFQSLVENARNAVSVKLSALRASGNLDTVSSPELSESSESESERDETENAEITEECTEPQPVKAKPEIKHPLSSEIEELMKKSKKSTYDEGVREGKRRRRLERAKTKGKGWFDLPATEMTKEIEMDLNIIKMRNCLNPKQFFKHSDSRAPLPKYFQIGTVQDSAVEFYSNRIPKKKRKNHIIDELLEDAEFKKFNKKNYDSTKKPMSRKKLKK